MPRPRRETVSNTKAGVYHIHCEFTQGFHFLGQDPVANRFCGYRRQWVIDKCNHLCRTFPVTVLSMTVRTHCYDMVIRFDPRIPRSWSDREVVEHWIQYFVVCRDDAEKRRQPTEEDIDEILEDHDRVAGWRQRLCLLGTFMQELNGRVASRINRENGGDGALWARRYESTPLLDELAVVTALAVKLGLKWLHLSWLGNGIYKGTKNPAARRRRRAKRRRDEPPPSSANPGRDHPPPE